MTVSSQTETIEAVARSAKDWLFNDAAPLWCNAGWSDAGMFAERLSLDGIPDGSDRRVFVQARHIYSFLQIGKMGWAGPWEARCNNALDFLLRAARRSDGFFVHSLTKDGEVKDGRADLYDQAFLMFCLGHAGSILNRPELFSAAKDIMAALDSKWRRNAGGYYEGEIVDQAVRLQNPHMHLFEAFSALARATQDEYWETRSVEIAKLCAERFIDKKTGALIEYFDEHLQPLTGIRGQIVEPGHCCEWAWLYEGLAANGWLDGIEISDRLVAFARQFGIHSRNLVMVNEVLLDGKPLNLSARLWPQTERLKAAIARHKRSRNIEEEQEIINAFVGLGKYLAVGTAGVWRDKLKDDGSWVDEPAPGSSFYHITCAYTDLIEYAEV